MLMVTVLTEYILCNVLLLCVLTYMGHRAWVNTIFQRGTINEMGAETQKEGK
jgi:hypothetical protein